MNLEIIIENVTVITGEFGEDGTIIGKDGGINGHNGMGMGSN